MNRARSLFAIIQRASTTRGTAVMGICNVTPDSFSDGGQSFDEEDARARVDVLLQEGADILDIGGESTRPGAAPVPASVQLARVLGVVRYAVEKAEAAGACVTIDTASPEVARACLDAGACAVNDVSCLRDDALADEIARADAAFILMHARGTQAEMRGFSDYRGAYDDVVKNVVDEWRAAAERAMARGVPHASLLMDPGLGFAKTAAQSADLLRCLPEMARAVEVPIVIGASRKSFLTKLTKGDPAPAERLGASIGAAVHASLLGAQVVRVHDVKATRQALEVVKALAALGGPDHA
ncbi:dihydropteroate synthase [Pendulispora rubella]|uniref:dihydropteroate synthase n=1 Tax=Pendulispora rubella TaxID=2741070 RepID=A0ABZ2KW14_9BACT